MHNWDPVGWPLCKLWGYHTSRETKVLTLCRWFLMTEGSSDITLFRQLVSFDFCLILHHCWPTVTLERQNFGRAFAIFRNERILQHFALFGPLLNNSHSFSWIWPYKSRQSGSHDVLDCVVFKCGWRHPWRCFCFATKCTDSVSVSDWSITHLIRSLSWYH